MLGTKLAFSTAYNPQKDGLAERMIQTMEERIRRFCAYRMEYKDHEGYTHDWVTLLPEIKLAYNTRRNSGELRLTEEFSRKRPVFPVSLVKHFHQKGEDKFPSRINSHTQQERVEEEDSPFPVKKIMQARKIRLNGKDHRQYLVRFKNQTADKDKWLAEYSIPDGKLYLQSFRAPRRAGKSHQ
ncbi:hypothetical protein O181_014625 [Austropuccinia psidii MF-1]|uniref:Integrase catalytic domain-containing protein n=1 Tax=Austropuccinia psidii MF-1 TaxID=1389203 RepID=A0A9Q3GQ38_9BASI|nr:hypothetical protein [Austropuccinia psidii MF-1]